MLITSMKLFNKKGTNSAINQTNEGQPFKTKEISDLNKSSIGTVKKNTKTRKLIIILAILLIIIFVIGVILAINKFSNKRPNLTEQQQADMKKTVDTMNKSKLSSQQQKDVASQIEMNGLIGKKRYAEAKKMIEESINNTNDTNTKSALYASLSVVCLPLNDFSCVDRVIVYQQDSSSFDVFFAIDAAHAAKTMKQFDLSKKYYKLALDFVDKNGGEAGAEKLSGNTESVINYQELKIGSQ